MGNDEIERLAIEHVMRLERQHGRNPVDVHKSGEPYDVYSPPRKIEVKAFGNSARTKQVPLENRQVIAALEDSENFYVYVVDHVIPDSGEPISVRVLHGEILRSMIERSTPNVTYWPSFRAAEYDDAERLS
jgi:hypothetical protein